MQTGDILLVHSKWCPISWMVRKITKSNWNHCALVVGSKHILDYTSNKIEIKPINRYSNKLLYKTAFIKLTDFNYDEKMEIVKYARNIQQKFKFEWHKFIISLIQIALGKRPMKATCSGFIANICRLYCLITFDKPYYFITPEDFYKMRKL